MAEIRSGPSLSPGYIIKYLIRLVSTNRILVQTKHLLTVGSARGAGREMIFDPSIFNELEISRKDQGPSSRLRYPPSLPYTMHYVVFDKNIGSNGWLDGGDWRG